MHRWLFHGLMVSTILLNSFSSSAQQALGTDIFLAKLQTVDGKLTTGSFNNISARKGYDNQPLFLSDGKHLLYTAEIDGQTDIFKLDLQTSQTINLTQSPENEYSPTAMPNGTEFSVILQFDGKQELWAYSLNGKKRRPLLQGDYLIGYHAWVNESTVLFTELGEGKMSLQKAPISSKQKTQIYPMTGASLFQLSNETMIFNTGIDKQHWLMQYHALDGEVSQLTMLPNDARYYGLSPSGKVIVASGAKLLMWDSQVKRNKNQNSESELSTFADIQSVCPEGASRIAVNAAETLIAIVCQGETF